MKEKFYKTKTGVTLTSDIEKQLVPIASAFYALTGVKITVTSGTRTPLSQASAMYRKCAAAGSLNIYRNKRAAGAIEKAYHEATAAYESEADTIAVMAQVINAQVESDIYISAHLRAGAVDIRSRDMSEGERVHFKKVADKHCETVLLERYPPHWHLQF